MQLPFFLENSGPDIDSVSLLTSRVQFSYLIGEPKAIRPGGCQSFIGFTSTSRSFADPAFVDLMQIVIVQVPWDQFLAETGVTSVSKHQTPAALNRWHNWAQEKYGEGLLSRHQVEVCYGPLTAVG